MELQFADCRSLMEYFLKDKKQFKKKIADVGIPETPGQTSAMGDTPPPLRNADVLN